MLEHEEPAQTLVNLGLTVLQAKVYLALAKSGNSTGRTTAKAAKVASQDVYRVLSELQEKGLVEKIISKPNEYRPIQIEEGLAILLQRRNNQTIEIKNRITEIVKDFSSIDKCEGDNEKCQFVWVPQKEISEKKFRNGVETAQTSVDLSSQFHFSMEGAERERDIILKSIERGVKFRELIDLSQGMGQESRAFSTLKRNPAYQTRFFCSTFPVKLEIKDKQEVLISIKNEKSNLNPPYLWSNNSCLVQVIQQWYDIMWEKGSSECQVAQ